MKVTRLEEAVKYTPPKHTENCHSMHLLGCSYYLPGAKAEWDASPLDKVYVVLEGELTMAFEDQEVKLGPMDSIYIGPDENREVRNDSNSVATMLVVMPYPPQ
jgi:mannose-6-phosphate isomerase-like protein (cupin superfamily)